MKDRHIPIMKGCPVEIHEKLILNGQEHGFNRVSFRFTLQYILRELGLSRMNSMQNNGHLYYLDNFNGELYDLRDKQQFLKLRDTVINEYNRWVEFYKNKVEKQK